MAEKNDRIVAKTESGELLLQWQTCVESANVVSQRRDVINGLFVTLNLAIVTTVAALWDARAFALLAVGAAICASWLLYITSFKKLNKAKFDIINEVETQLPTQPFKDEWGVLTKDKRYVKGSTIEKVLPISFLIVYAALLIFLIFCK
ncbi:RipA family octameric membrane protein [Ellagibacter isourolithinifaciens]|uniref:RipA family octameric membrane protein n=1 Tax=Ellagibacter isourolithinifaciens TaxID=2137581 RepID=UPI003AB84B85